MKRPQPILDPTRVLAAVALFALGCGGPLAVFPGGALSGKVASEPVLDWSHVESGAYALETRPSDPYSVNVNVFSKGGALYVDPAPERRWAQHMAEDPDVRLRIDGLVYPLTAIRVDDPVALGFEAERTVYRLDPRAG